MQRRPQREQRMIHGVGKSGHGPIQFGIDFGLPPRGTWESGQSSGNHAQDLLPDSISRLTVSQCSLSVTENTIYMPTPFVSSYFITAQTTFHHCTFSFITAHFVHHCTLKQALAMTMVVVHRNSHSIFFWFLPLWFDAASVNNLLHKLGYEQRYM